MTIDPEREPTFAARRRELADVLMRDCGVVRDRTGPMRALDYIDHVPFELADQSEHVLEYHARRNRHMNRVARVTVTAALARDDSLGVHYRRDTPDNAALVPPDPLILRSNSSERCETRIRRKTRCSATTG